MPQGAKHPGIEARLKRVEGQVRGIARMVTERRYCIDILQQLTAARRALDQVGLAIMQGHINSCVSEAIRHKDGTSKVAELMRTLQRFVK
jgi:DNA-binding FrmR family transcriptional regulator